MEYTQTEYLQGIALVIAFVFLGMLFVCIPRPRAKEYLDPETAEKVKKKRAKEKAIAKTKKANEKKKKKRDKRRAKAKAKKK